MNRLEFTIVTCLSGVIALCIFLQIIFVRFSAADELRLRQTDDTLQQAQQFYTHSRQIAQRIAQVAQQQNDPALKDLLTRQNITIKSDTNAAPAAPEAPSTH